MGWESNPAYRNCFPMVLDFTGLFLYTQNSHSELQSNYLRSTWSHLGRILHSAPSSCKYHLFAWYHPFLEEFDQLFLWLTGLSTCYQTLPSAHYTLFSHRILSTCGLRAGSFQVISLNLHLRWYRPSKWRATLYVPVKLSPCFFPSWVRLVLGTSPI